MGVFLGGVVWFFAVVKMKKKPPQPGMHIFGAISIMIVPVVVSLLLFLSTGGMKIVIEPGKVVISSMKDKVITYDSIKSAEVIRYDELGEMQPVKRTNGTAVGDIRTGWWNLRNGKEAFLVLAGEDVLLVQTKQGDVYLLGPREFSDFVKDFTANINIE
jgi:hypothetical protein